MTPAELASIAVDSGFEMYGRTAVYRPSAALGGPSIGCTVLRDQSDVRVALGGSRASVQGNVFRVRRSEVAKPQPGGTITFVEDGTRYKIEGGPRTAEDDPERLVWVLTLVAVPGVGTPVALPVPTPPAGADTSLSTGDDTVLTWD